MARKVVIDKLQFIKALGTLHMSVDGLVKITDVLGIISCCNTWLTNQEETEITSIPTLSQRRRIELQILESDDAKS